MYTKSQPANQEAAKLAMPQTLTPLLGLAFLSKSDNPFPRYWHRKLAKKKPTKKLKKFDHPLFKGSKYT